METKKRWLRLLGYLLGFGVLVGIAYVGGIEALQSTLTPHLDFLALYLLANLGLYGVSSVRWGHLVNTLEGKRVCSQFDYFFFFMSSRFFGQYVSQTGGDLLLRPGLLKQTNSVSFKKGIYVIFWEKIFDLLFICSITGPAFLYLFKMIAGYTALLLTLGTFGLLFALFAWKSDQLLLVTGRLLHSLYFWIKSLPWLGPRLPKKYLTKIQNLDRLVLLQRKTLLLLVGITLFRYVFIIGRHYFLVAALGLAIPLPAILVGIPVAQLTLLLAFTPGALGVLEGGWYTVFALSGVPLPDNSAFLLGQRGYSLIATSLIFLLSYLVFGLKNLFDFDADNLPAERVVEE